MKQFLEKEIKIGFTRSPENMINEIERICEQMNQEGWSFIRSVTDQILEKVTLFFEKEGRV